ncbi:uncharacterized protein J3D65DRAFT_602149 [Phyllosticta citribraziliensis]|uniref:Nucleoporin NUP49/NSP49 n=1 Tax=Phyllosticta citribraziliensis TaxID=989973 RepID=A0ABR1LTU0_9PEZI
MSFGGLGKSGGLTINTGGGLFGNNTSQPQSTGLGGTSAQGGGLFGSGANTSGGGLFGQNKPAQTNTSGSSLFGSNTATSAPGGGLFGGGQAATTTGGGLFGSSTATSAPGGGLFGGGTTTSSQPQQQQGGGLFGNAQASQPSAPSLFGSSATQNKPSLFGSSTNNTSQPQQSAFGGAMNNQPQGLFGAGGGGTNQTGGGLFGGLGGQSAPTNQSTTGLPGGLFGAGAAGANSSTTGFSGGLLGGASTNQQTVPGVRIDLSNIRGSTRFSDLHDDLQKEIEKYDQFIQDQIQAHDKCAAFIDGRIKESLSYLPSDVEFVNTKVEAVEAALDNDSQAIASLKETFKTDAENARIAFRVIENLKLPAQYHYSGSMWNPVQQPTKAKSDALSDDDDGNTDLVAYFTAQAKDLDKTLETQARLLMEIEQHLRTVESTTMQQLQESMARGNVDGVSARETRLRELAQLFQEIQKAILFEAQKVGDCREKVVEASLGQAGGPWRP